MACRARDFAYAGAAGKSSDFAPFASVRGTSLIAVGRRAGQAVGALRGIVVAVAGLAWVLSITPAVSADQPSSELHCELSQPGDFSCGHIVAVAGTVAPIADGSVIRVVDTGGGPIRTSPDIALVVITSPGQATRLVLVGYVGIDIEPHAWVPDRATYAAWYARFVDSSVSASGVATATQEGAPVVLIGLLGGVALVATGLFVVVHFATKRRQADGSRR